MRTSGKFQDVYKAARELINDVHDRPTNPVVRLEGNTWMLESDLETSDCTVEIPLDAFHDYWFEAMTDTEYMPSESDIADYLQILKD